MNTSPEQVSSIALSTVEDATAGLLYAAHEYPQVAAAIAVALLLVITGLLLLARRILRRLFARRSLVEVTPPS